MSLTLKIYGQELRTIHGKIISAEDKSPLPLVNIIERGTKNGTLSNSNGEFQLLVKGDTTIYLVIMAIDLHVFSKYSKTDESKIIEISPNKNKLTRESERVNKEWTRLQKRKKKVPKQGSKTTL
ncbi:MAG: carboxypeptidase-like regulatory domain-containing protein [Cyclobacteriaceae bacterium]|nr:carboxypeptidase-like regulatory domain-containing protein [Cyclobacteriaceae bacterium]